MNKADEENKKWAALWDWEKDEFKPGRPMKGELLEEEEEEPEEGEPGDRINEIPVALQILLNMPVHYTMELYNVIKGMSTSEGAVKESISRREQIMFRELMISISLHTTFRKIESMVIPAIPPIDVLLENLTKSVKLQIRVGLLLKYREKFFEKVEKSSIPLSLIHKFESIRYVYEKELEKL